MPAPNLLVTGLAKTGTTGLYHALKHATRPLGDYAYMYEPKEPLGLLSLLRYAPERPVLAKILLYQLDNCAVRYPDFDHRFVTVRDPRDVVVSRLLFRPVLLGTAHRLPVEQLQPFVAALRDKERDPASWSVLDLYRLADELGMRSTRWRKLVRQMDQVGKVVAAQGLTVVAYEDLVADRLEVVSEQVGVEVTNPTATSTGGWLDHIVRSRGQGEWRHWFTHADVAFFRDHLGAAIASFEYPDDWELAAEPLIDPATASGYVERKLQQHIEEVRQRKGGWTPQAVTDTGELERMRGMAEDGRATWAYRLAQVHHEGVAELRDHTEAVRWAREAAIRGHAPAMGLLADLLADGGAETRAQARFWLCEHDRATGVQRETRRPRDGGTVPDTRELRRLEEGLAAAKRELAAVRRSARYRAGSLLAEAARDPVRRGPSTLWALGRLALRRGRHRGGGRGPRPDGAGT